MLWMFQELQRFYSTLKANLGTFDAFLFEVCWMLGCDRAENQSRRNQHELLERTQVVRVQIWKFGRSGSLRDIQDLSDVTLSEIPRYCCYLMTLTHYLLLCERLA